MDNSFGKQNQDTEASLNIASQNQGMKKVGTTEPSFLHFSDKFWEKRSVDK